MSSSKSFRADSVYFHHQSDTTKDVKFHTTGNFDLKNPIKCQEYIINDKYKIIESGDIGNAEESR